MMNIDINTEHDIYQLHTVYTELIDNIIEHLKDFVFAYANISDTDIPYIKLKEICKIDKDIYIKFELYNRYTNVYIKNVTFALSTYFLNSFELSKRVNNMIESNNRRAIILEQAAREKREKDEYNEFLRLKKKYES